MDYGRVKMKDKVTGIVTFVSGPLTGLKSKVEKMEEEGYEIVGSKKGDIDGK